MCRSFGVYVLLMISDFKNNFRINVNMFLRQIQETNEVVFIHFLCVLAL